MNEISELGNTGVRVVLIRRTGQDTVKTSVGYRDAAGNIRNWYGANPPTHFCALPAYPDDKAGRTRKKLTGAS